MTIKGSNLTAATGVRFGSTASGLVKVTSDSELSALVPPGKAGSVSVTVAGPNGTSPANAAAGFTYTTAPATTPTTTTPTTPVRSWPGSSRPPSWATATSDG